MKKILVFMLAAALVLSLSVTFMACDSGDDTETDGCTEHVDADDNAKCDKCGADFEDGVECDTHRDANDDGQCDICGENFDDGIEQITAEVTFSLVIDGKPAPEGIKFTLEGSKATYELTSGADGSVKETVAVGSYAVTFDYDTVPSGCLPITESVEIKSDTTAFELSIIDNNPDGSAEKPFFISEDTTSFAVAAGAEVFYRYRGAAVRTLVIENAGISVTYKGQVYEAVDGVVSVVISPEMGSMTGFSIKNNTSDTIENSFTLKSPEGSMDNPIKLEGEKVDVNVPADGAVYYSFTANKSGVVIVSSESELNNISLTNTATNAVSALTSGAKATYMAVSEGDVIKIEVSSTNSKEAAVIDVSVACYAGSEEDPVPMVMERVDFAFAPSQALVFTAEVGKVVTLTDTEVTLGFGDAEYTPTDVVKVQVTLEGEGETVKFTLTNKSEEVNGVEFEVK